MDFKIDLPDQPCDEIGMSSLNNTKAIYWNTALMAKARTKRTLRRMDA